MNEARHMIQAYSLRAPNQKGLHMTCLIRVVSYWITSLT